MPSTPVLAVGPLLLSLAAVAATAQVPAPPANHSGITRQESELPSTSPADSGKPADDATAGEAAPVASPTSQTDTVNAHTGIRIVRLSQTKGVVSMDRGPGSTEIGAVGNENPDHRFEPAFDNLPVIQGAQIRTGEGVAEVEFEDNTTLRLAPETLVRFTTLNRAPSGSTTSIIEVVHGMVYATQVKTKGNLFALSFGPRRAVLEPGTHIKLQVDSPATHLTVLDGVASVESPSGTLAVAKKHGLLVDQDHPETATLTGKDIDNTTFDAWDKQSASYHQNVSNVSAYAGTGFGSGLYGLNDMNYYGSFVNMGSCGSLWQPYFASAGWNPYSYGAFAYYPGAGYSFVSLYPWGWTPFHSGSWQQCGANGWGWRPGGGFVGLTNTRQLQATGTRPPLLPPHRGQLGVTIVSAHPVVVSTATREGAFVFNKDSAGLGVPRQSFGKLAAASKLVAEHGSANVALAPAELPMARGSLPAHAALVTSLHPAAAGGVSSGVHPAAAYTGPTADAMYSSPSTLSTSSRGPSAPSVSAPSASHGASGGSTAGASGGGGHH